MSIIDKWCQYNVLYSSVYYSEQFSAHRITQFITKFPDFDCSQPFKGTVNIIFKLPTYLRVTYAQFKEKYIVFLLLRKMLNSPNFPLCFSCINTKDNLLINKPKFKTINS